MRILHFSDCFYPEMSGISDSIRMSGRALTQRGHCVAYAAPRFAGRDYARLGPKARAEQSAGATVLRLPSLPAPFSPTGQSRTALPIGASLGFARKFKPDVIHAHTPWGSGWEALLAARRLGVPAIATNHTLIEEFARYGGIASALAPGLRRYAAFVYGRFALVTAPSESLIADMRIAGFRGSAHAVANPVDLARFHPVEAGRKAAAKTRLGLQGPTLLYAGRLAPEKNVDQILRALALLAERRPGIRFVATGFGASGPALQRMAADLGLGESVRFVGFVDEESLVELYAAADAFVMMSTAESQSIALMQAMACGLPTLAARAGALPEFVAPETGVLVAPGDVAELAGAIDRLVGGGEDALRLGKNAARAARRFSTEAIAARWEAIYEEAATVVSLRRPRAAP